jgi:hypothetical protein
MKQILTYNGWQIYQLSSKDRYVAIKEGKHPIEGVDVPDLKADIDEAEK